MCRQVSCGCFAMNPTRLDLIECSVCTSVTVFGHGHGHIFQMCLGRSAIKPWVVDKCPCFTVDPWPSSIIFISMGDLRGPYQRLALDPRVTVISTPGDARSTRSQSVQSVHPPPRPLPIQNWPPSRPFRGESEQVEQPVRERPPSHQVPAPPTPPSSTT